MIGFAVKVGYKEREKEKEGSRKLIKHSYLLPYFQTRTPSLSLVQSAQSRLLEGKRIYSIRS